MCTAAFEPVCRQGAGLRPAPQERITHAAGAASSVRVSGWDAEYPVARFDVVFDGHSTQSLIATELGLPPVRIKDLPVDTDVYKGS